MMEHKWITNLLYSEHKWEMDGYMNKDIRYVMKVSVKRDGKQTMSEG